MIRVEPHATYFRPKHLVNASPEQLWRSHMDIINAEKNLVDAIASKKVRHSSSARETA
jgi:hypothetical protein